MTEGSTEYTRYATIADLTSSDRKHHRNDMIARDKTICSVCGIEFHTYISSTCPLCELKKMLTDVKGMEYEPDKIVQQEVSAGRKSGEALGDVITLGMYAGQPIEWLVLSVEDDRALILSRYILDAMPYNSELKDVTWSECSLRTYLNTEFYWNYFSDLDRQSIEQVTVENPYNPVYGTAGGKDTVDWVFCLSIDEAKKYFKNNVTRAASPAVYSRGKFEMVKDAGGAYWWLRSPGYYGSRAANVHDTGYIAAGGGDVDNENIGIRPAMWIKL